MTKRIDTDMGTMTLTEFLLARIAEDMAAVVMMPPHPTFVDRVIDRKHLLAECEAKRRIIEEHAPVISYPALVCPHGEVMRPEGPLVCDMCGQTGGSYSCATLAYLAAVYADHPDYREEWRDT
jgi:hypothetical protein